MRARDDKEAGKMKCPICGKEMEEGGLVVQGVSAIWFPKEEYEKKGPARVAYTGGKALKGRTNFLLDHTRIDGAYYCPACDKVAGIFGVDHPGTVKE